DLYAKKLSRKSVSRTLSCLRSFFSFLERENKIELNPFLHIPLPKQDQYIPDFFYEKELNELFRINDVTTSIGQRNQALLETFYATGIRVSECRALKVSKIDFSLGMLMVLGKGRKERLVPFGQYAKEALETYIDNGRKQLLAKSKEPTDYLFLNANGKPLTTRGIHYILNTMIQKTS